MNVADNLEANVNDGVAANNIDDIHIEYHPNAAIPPQEIPFTEFARGHRPRAYKPNMSTDPWYLFWSHLDFEFAELALKAALNKEQVNCLLCLMKSIRSVGEVFTLNEYNDLQSTWRATSHRMMAPQEFTMYYRSLWDWACSLLKHPSIGPHFPWMANKFWNIQVLLFILYADKVKLLSFGQQKGYPVIAHLTNLPVSIQNGEGIGGGHVIGWLPIICVKETKEHSGKTWFANFKNVVWHKSFRKLLQMIEKESQAGCWVNCWDGIPCCFFPTVLILSADYEEYKNVLKVLEDAHSQDTREKKEQILIQQGLHDVDKHCEMLAVNFSGKFGDHLWAELLRILDKAGHQTMAMVEKNFSMMPRWHTLNHFDEALSISYTDGQKFEDLSKIVVFACHDILPQNTEKEGYLLLHSLELHMMHTIAAGQEALSTFNALMQKYAQKTDNMKKNWNFPKNHTCMHAFNDIKAKGITHNFNTKPNEKMHGPLKEKYQKHTNFKNVAQQILDVNHLKAVLELIHCRISNYDVYLSNMEADMRSSEGNDVDNVEQEDFFHVRLGSRVKQPLALGAIEQRSTTDKAFMHFEITGKPLPGGKHIQFQADNEITEHRYVKVNFEPMTNWCQYMDHLWCNPSFHGHSHYDCILLKMCTVALVQPYDAPTGPQLAKDVHLNLWRVHEQPHESAEIFSVHLIIHGALLYPDHTRLGKHLVIDTIDTDMFLRMQMMHKATGHH
ncbi:hypothetical protein BKA83DRAFT_4467353 [Pisolithus microcarpus]|nr:hypothetical protein BKA83DRAFT_4467353 [Pisolithus microcarpus]